MISGVGHSWFLDLVRVAEERKFADFQLIPSRVSAPSLHSILAIAATRQFPAARMQFLEQPFPVFSESVFSLSLGKISLLYFITFLRLIKWLSISSLCFLEELL